MKLKDYIIMLIVFSMIPFSLFLWINNIATANVINDMTLAEYVSPKISEEELADIVKEFSNDDIEIVEEVIEEPKSNKTSVVMNFTGDCTLGSDSNYGYKNTFFEMFDKQQNYGYFFSNMQSLFANDDVTCVNLEGTFTDYMVKTPKEFNFRASPEYANIILSGDIDIVNIANNHTMDYGQTGFDDTIKTLEEYNIPYFGYDDFYIYQKDDIKIGFVGLTKIWDGTVEKRIDNAIAYFKENECNSIIFTFHWGIERKYQQNSTQQKVAHYAIDHGADLVVGHHPHVLQGIEEYNGKYIVYSLGNFCFGGNTNPPDKDTMVFNIIFDYEDGVLVNAQATVYPARVSSVNYVNDYRPTLASGDEYTRIMNKISKYSNVDFMENGVLKKKQ